MSSLPRCLYFPHFLVSALIGLGLTTQAHASDVRQSDSARPIREASATVPFDLYGGYFMVVRGSVGPLKNLNFFLDTGTSLPVLDSQVAEKLHLHGDEHASVVIVGGRMPGEKTRVPSLELGPLERSNLEVVTADLSFFRKFLPVRINAIVGLNVLGQSPFVIDYSSRVIRFGMVPALPVSVPLRLDGGLAVFDAEIDQTPIHLLFDTGASSLILFAREAIQDSRLKGSEILSPEAIGNFKSKEIRLHSLRLGAEEFGKEPALLTRNPKPSQIDFDGVTSPTALGMSRVSIDLQAGVLAFSR